MMLIPFLSYYILLCLEKKVNPLTAFMLFCVTAYRYIISPLMPICCVHEKTCSEYALEILRNHTLPRALLLITVRLVSCHPFCRSDKVLCTHKEESANCNTKSFPKKRENI